MVRGIVIETINLDDRVWVNSRGVGGKHNDQCAIYVEKNAKSLSISEGDRFWWKGRYAMWTPYGSTGKPVGDEFDIEIPRIGLAGVVKPKA